MRNVESSMDWMSFSNKMKQVACRLSSSACPMVLVLPDGREIRFTDINVDTFDYKGKRGDTEYTSIGFKVNLLGAEVTDVQDDGSLANSPSGNGAKMRGALLKIVEVLEPIVRSLPSAEFEIAKKALAEPPRNCDRFCGDPKKLHEEWWEWSGDPRNCNADGTVKLTYGEWLLAEAKGDAK